MRTRDEFRRSCCKDDGRLFLTGMQEVGRRHDLSAPPDEDSGSIPPSVSASVQQVPVEVPLGPLAGKNIVSLSADVHHTFAVTGTLARRAMLGDC